MLTKNQYDETLAHYFALLHAGFLPLECATFLAHHAEIQYADICFTMEKHYE